MNKLHIFLIFLTSCFYYQCIPPSNEVVADINIDFDDKKMQRLYMFQDRQLVDSLYQFVKDGNPTFRYMVANAFASIQSDESLDTLLYLLNDPSEEVKTMAAYAIGQIGNNRTDRYLLSAFDQLDSAGNRAVSNAAILEAIGKSASAKYLEPLSTVSSYEKTDTILLEGQAYAIYRYALRGITAPEGTQRMLELATDTDYPNSVRVIAANYLYRVQKINLAGTEQELVRVLTGEDDPQIRMTLTIALGKTKSELAKNTLFAIAKTDADPRVRANAIRALQNFEYAEVEQTILAALKDNNPQVVQTATQYFVNNGVPPSATLYWRTAKDTSLNWTAQIGMYQAANKFLPPYFEDNKKYIQWELKRRFEGSNAPYEKAAIVEALSEFGWNYAWIKRLAFPADEPVVRSAAIRAFAKMLRNPNFDRTYGLGARRIRGELINYLAEAVSIGDPGMIAEAAIVMRDSIAEFKTYFDSIPLLEQALEKFDLPREIEPYNELKKSIGYLKNGVIGEPIEPEFNHPIDWITFDEVNANQKAVIKTAKGDITIDLYPKLAPGSVVNFVRLVKNGFYQNKVFHRVVPNFVVQAGCPRGDGYGSLDYTIRSELPYLHYDDAGYVGMASAGNNTEGTQFFITHSPALHLDGKYTIFGKVSEGIDVVQRIEVGDAIKEIVLK